MSLNILFSSRWGKFWPKRFKIGLFLKQKYEIFRGFLEIFRKFFGIFRHFFENFRKDIRRFYVIFVSRPSHKVISFIITVTCLPSLQKYKGVTLPYLTRMGDGNENVKRATAILIKQAPMYCVPVA